MKASKLLTKDVVFIEGRGFLVTDAYLSTNDVMIVSFSNGYSVQLDPDTDILVARNGQVL